MLMATIRDLAIRVEDLHLRLKRIEENADMRHSLIADWIGPDVSRPAEEIELPDDIKRLLRP